jgi:hypothetical protein
MQSVLNKYIIFVTNITINEQQAEIRNIQIQGPHITNRLLVDTKEKGHFQD